MVDTRILASDMLLAEGDSMLHDLLGAVMGLALVVSSGPIDVTSFAGEPQALPAKAKSKHKHKKKHKHGMGVAGSFSVVHSGPPTVTPVAPDLCVIELHPSFVFVDDLQGSFTSNFVIEHAGPCDQPAPQYFSTDGVWAGSILGRQGGFTYNFEGSIDEQGIATGVLSVVEDSGTGELDDIEGSLTMTGLAGVEGTYSGTLQL